MKPTCAGAECGLPINDGELFVATFDASTGAWTPFHDKCVVRGSEPDTLKRFPMNAVRAGVVTKVWPVTA